MNATPSTNGTLVVTNPLLHAALEYAEMGWHVLPLNWIQADGSCSCGKVPCEGKPGKHPLTRNGVKDATDDGQDILHWWTRWPLANVAIATGPESGVWVVGPDGDQGIAELAALVAEHPDAPLVGPWSRTGSGGEHHLFTWPGDDLPILNHARHLGTEIDVRAAGKGPGYIVAPPSKNANGPYAWVVSPTEAAIGPAPAWLLDWARHDKRPRPAPLEAPAHRVKDWYTDRKTVLDRATKYLEKVPASVSGSGGHNALLWAASCLVHGFELADHEAEMLLLADFNPRCVGPWPEADVKRKVKEARANPLDKGRGWLLNSPDPLRDHPPPSGWKKGGERIPAVVVSESWEEPLPLDMGHKVQPFPVRVLPLDLSDFVQHVALATNTPPDYVGAASLGITAGLTGSCLNFDVKEEYPEICSAYICIVAPKGSGKTPAVNYLLRPLVKEQSRRVIEGNKVRAYVGNVTVEKMADMMQASPRGLLMVRDEAAALFGGFNQYKAGGKGSDRQFYLEVASGTAQVVDRKNPELEPVYVPHPRLSIVCGIQPKILSRYTGDSDDGLFDRFLYAYPDPLKMQGENGFTVVHSLRESWSTAVGRMLAQRMEERPARPDRPYFLKREDDAWEVWKEWTHWLAAVANSEEFHEELRGPVAKLRGFAARLAIVAHVLRQSYLPEAIKRIITVEDMTAGVTLAKYFLSHARRVWTESGRDERVVAAKKILRWAISTGESRFTRRDLWRGLRKSFPDMDDLAAPLAWLVQLGHIRPGESVATKGRPTGPNYEIHPSHMKQAGPADGDDEGPKTSFRNLEPG